MKKYIRDISESGITEKEWETKQKSYVMETWNQELYALTLPRLKQLFHELGSDKDYIAFRLIQKHDDSLILSENEYNFVKWLWTAGYNLTPDGTDRDKDTNHITSVALNNYIQGKCYASDGDEKQIKDIVMQYLARVRLFTELPRPRDYETEITEEGKKQLRKYTLIDMFYTLICSWQDETDYNFSKALASNIKSDQYPKGYDSAKPKAIGILKDNIRPMQARNGEQPQRGDYWAVVSYNPRVIASMSTGVSWRSCHSLDPNNTGIICYLVGSTIAAGSFIVFIMRQTVDAISEKNQTSIESGEMPLSKIFDESNSLFKASGRFLYKPYFAVKNKRLFALLADDSDVDIDKITQLDPSVDPDRPETLYDFSQGIWKADATYGTIPKWTRDSVTHIIDAAQTTKNIFHGAMPKHKDGDSFTHAMYSDIISKSFTRYSENLQNVIDGKEGDMRAATIEVCDNFLSDTLYKLIYRHATRSGKPLKDICKGIRQSEYGVDVFLESLIEGVFSHESSLQVWSFILSDEKLIQRAINARVSNGVITAVIGCTVAAIHRNVKSRISGMLRILSEQKWVSDNTMRTLSSWGVIDSRTYVNLCNVETIATLIDVIHGSADMKYAIAFVSLCKKNNNKTALPWLKKNSDFLPQAIYRISQNNQLSHYIRLRTKSVSGTLFLGMVSYCYGLISFDDFANIIQKKDIVLAKECARTIRTLYDIEDGKISDLLEKMKKM